MSSANRRRFLRIALASFFVLLSTVGSLLWAQRVTGTITGIITDETGAVLPGVNITVVNARTQEARKTVSDEAGNYAVPSLPPGSYNVVAELPGFKKAMRENIVLTVAEVARVDVTLQVGEITETVTVTEKDTSNRISVRLGYLPEQNGLASNA